MSWRLAEGKYITQADADRMKEKALSSGFGASRLRNICSDILTFPKFLYDLFTPPPSKKKLQKRSERESRWYITKADQDRMREEALKCDFSPTLLERTTDRIRQYLPRKQHRGEE